MKSRWLAMALVVLPMALAGCGQKSSTGESSTSTPAPSAGGGAAAFTVPANLDQGPRAAESEANESRRKPVNACFRRVAARPATPSASASRARISTA